MKYKTILLSLMVLKTMACNKQAPTAAVVSQGEIKTTQEQVTPLKQPQLNAKGKVISTRYLLPKDYVRKQAPSNSFAYHLRNLPLKEVGEKVKMYDGGIKENFDVYSGVVNLPIGARNLHQCADAVMRLKADYHFKHKEYHKIHFNLTNGFNLTYAKWREGYRVKVKGNKTSWVKSGKASDSKYWKYLEMVFAYAGTLSLSKELKSKDISKMEIGDVFIQGGSPGHAIIVVDMAEHKITGKSIFMLAQSYMPAQEIQILLNPTNKSLGSWYELNDEFGINTPEWNFTSEDLKTFKE